VAEVVTERGSALSWRDVAKRAVIEESTVEVSWVEPIEVKVKGK
jgi:hypothetical protein